MVKTLLHSVCATILACWHMHNYKDGKGKRRSNLRAFFLSKCQLVGVLGPECIAMCPYPRLQAPQIGLQVGGQQS